MPKKIPFIEESGTGRQWTSYSALAEDLNKTTEQVKTAITKDIPINGRYYFKINRNESICWRCKNTIEGECDLFTKKKRKPPKGAKYKTINQVGGGGKPYTAYLVTKCKRFAPEYQTTIVR